MVTAERESFEVYKKSQAQAHRDLRKLKEVIQSMGEGIMQFTIDVSTTRIKYVQKDIHVEIPKTKKPIIGHPAMFINVESTDKFVLEYVSKKKTDREFVSETANRVKEMFFGPKNKK